VVLIVLCVGIYLVMHPYQKIVRMKEDVMYVKPISNIK
jgi:hypothetical protein